MVTSGLTSALSAADHGHDKQCEGDTDHESNRRTPGWPCMLPREPGPSVRKGLDQHMPDRGANYCSDDDPRQIFHFLILLPLNFLHPPRRGGLAFRTRRRLGYTDGIERPSKPHSLKCHVFNSVRERRRRVTGLCSLQGHAPSYPRSTMILGSFGRRALPRDGLSKLPTILANLRPGLKRHSIASSFGH